MKAYSSFKILDLKDEFLICKDAIVNEGWTILGKVTKGLEVLDNIVENDKIVNITIRERNAE